MVISGGTATRCLYSGSRAHETGIGGRYGAILKKYETEKGAKSRADFRNVRIRNEICETPSGSFQRAGVQKKEKQFGP